MDTPIIVALIGLAGSVIVAVLNQLLAGRVKVQAKEIAWLKALIGFVTSDSERAHLRALDRDGPYIKEIRRGSGFEWELRHLLSIQLVERLEGKGMRTLFGLSGNQNVKEHLRIAQRGRDYLRIFDEAFKAAAEFAR